MAKARNIYGVANRDYRLALASLGRTRHARWLLGPARVGQVQRVEAVLTPHPQPEERPRPPAPPPPILRNTMPPSFPSGSGQAVTTEPRGMIVRSGPGTSFPVVAEGEEALLPGDHVALLAIVPPQDGEGGVWYEVITPANRFTPARDTRVAVRGFVRGVDGQGVANFSVLRLPRTIKVTGRPQQPSAPIGSFDGPDPGAVPSECRAMYDRWLSAHEGGQAAIIVGTLKRQYLDCVANRVVVSGILPRAPSTGQFVELTRILAAQAAARGAAAVRRPGLRLPSREEFEARRLRESVYPATVWARAGVAPGAAAAVGDIARIALSGDAGVDIYVTTADAGSVRGYVGGNIGGGQLTMFWNDRPRLTASRQIMQAYPRAQILHVWRRDPDGQFRQIA